MLFEKKFKQQLHVKGSNPLLIYFPRAWKQMKEEGSYFLIFLKVDFSQANTLMPRLPSASLY